MIQNKNYLYSFNDRKIISHLQWEELKNLLGSKGAGLAIMSQLGMPVPPGFIITTQVGQEYIQGNKGIVEQIWPEVLKQIKKIEQLTKTKFGDINKPLLLSVRSGSKYSMPGMMDTILNIGLNAMIVETLIKKTSQTWFVLDSYRRFIAMFGTVVMKIKSEEFESRLKAMKDLKKIKSETEFNELDLKKLIEQFLVICQEKSQVLLPEDPVQQLKLAIETVFSSWDNPRAIKYRQLNNITERAGTACTVMAMVFGNMGQDSGAGVLFTRNPLTGQKELFGEYLVNVQGEDVVAGTKTPMALTELKIKEPKIYQQLEKYSYQLEKYYQDMLDIEFTVQTGSLYLLQARVGKRTPLAAVKIAVDLNNEKIINQEKAVLRVTPQQINALLYPIIDPNISCQILAKGLPVSPGAAVGRVVFDTQAAKTMVQKKEPVILVRPVTTPEDIEGMSIAQGFITSQGGATSHAAVVARGIGKPCVVGCQEMDIDLKTKCFKINKVIIREGDYITINGHTGHLIAGKVPLLEAKVPDELAVFMKYVNQIKGLKVRANADMPREVKIAKQFGAEGIGLCRTEHMFFAEDRIKMMQAMILADQLEERKFALTELLSLQRSDFIEILKEMEPFPVTIRLLDAPLHEFLPSTGQEVKQLAKKMNWSVEKISQRVKELHESNPMLGHRGCRIAITYPEIYQMQVQAIIEAACFLKMRQIEPVVEIMIPLISDYQELKILQQIIVETVHQVQNKGNCQVKYKLGIMIETPRAALISEQIAPLVDFYSFGTNDLTQTVYGISRDDAGKFLNSYLEKKIFKVDPFTSIDQVGVGWLMKHAVEKGRAMNSDLKIGICGEHGGDSQSIEFCHQIGLDYVSCSSYRVLAARLAASQAVLNLKRISQLNNKPIEY